VDDHPLNFNQSILFSPHLRLHLHLTSPLLNTPCFFGLGEPREPREELIGFTSSLSTETTMALSRMRTKLTRIQRSNVGTTIRTFRGTTFVSEEEGSSVASATPIWVSTYSLLLSQRFNSEVAFSPLVVHRKTLSEIQAITVSKPLAAHLGLVTRLVPHLSLLSVVAKRCRLLFGGCNWRRQGNTVEHKK